MLTRMDKKPQKFTSLQTAIMVRLIVSSVVLLVRIIPDYDPRFDRWFRTFAATRVITV
jgi:hypothetical protein